jgi:arabinan endo-1,5-alpha-L-arabinosidase
MWPLTSLSLGLIVSVHLRWATAAPYPPEADFLQDNLDGLDRSGPLEQTTVSTDYPFPNLGNVQVHDPNILSYNGELYLFKGAIGIDVFKAVNISGPWTPYGTVLDGPSVIDKPSVNRTHPWAPTVIASNNTFYCFYAVTKAGTRNSAIGLATSTTLEPHSWTDHGALFSTYDGQFADISPFTVSNAIDPAAMIDPVTGKGWLSYGSYWTDIWQLPLSDDLLSIENPSAPVANHLSFLALEGKSNTLLSWYPLSSDPQGSRPEEGSFLSYHEPYYYLWFSHGKCCHFNINALPPAGDEYSIRVGRSTNITGPYVDINGVQLTEGGGGTVYASNHDNEVYAPGGLGVLNLDDGNDILYYHYCECFFFFSFLVFLFLFFPLTLLVLHPIGYESHVFVLTINK